MEERAAYRGRIAIIGAGPVGLALAVGLARSGVRSVVLERNPTTSGTSKAPGLHIRTREILRQWGIEDQALESGQLWESVTLHRLDPKEPPLLSVAFEDLAVESDRPGLLILEQSGTERLLLEAAEKSGLCDVRFGAEAIGLRQDAERVRVRYRSDGSEDELEAEFAVGCDGAGSFVREALGLRFDGTTYSLRPMLADVRVRDERDALPQPRVWTGPGGYRFTARLRPGLWRIVHLPQGEPAKEEVPDEEVMELAEQLLGPGPAEVTWASRFRIHVRSSPRFRVGRVILAGDAAHVHSPASGHGMNGGIQDAHNLAWKLAAALRGGDTERLLHSYEVERRAVVVETTSRYTDRITRIFIQAPPLVREGAWTAVRAMMKIPTLRRRYLRRLAMLDLQYPTSPLLRRSWRARGTRLPNPVLRSGDGTELRLYDLLPNAPVILEVRDRPGDSIDLPVETAIRIGPGGYSEPAGLLKKLLDDRDGWILVRPDAYVAWARHTADGLDEAARHALGERPR